MSARRTYWRLFKQTSVEWHRDKAQWHSAALAFYTVFSLAPILVILVLAAGFLVGREASQTYLVGKIGGMMGREAAEAVSGVLLNARKPLPSIVATLFSLGTLFWGASTVFGSLADSLNSIWGAKRDGGKYGIKGFVKHRLLAFTMVVGTGVYLVLSFVGTAGLAAVGKFLQGLLPLPLFMFQLLDFAGSVAAMAVLFAVIFKLVPAVRQRWSDVFPGALLTALLFAAGKYLIGLYFVKTTVASAYGAAGSFVVLLIWIYFAAQIFYFGAECNKVFMRLHGSGKIEDQKTEGRKTEGRKTEGRKTEGQRTE
jgi:membrane protein